MKVTVFNGSPRGRTSNSHRIVQPLLEGAREAGAETEEVFLIEKNIEHCRGCFACWAKTPGKCIIDDDMTELLDRYIESDYIGMATPLYGMFMTAVLKNFTDRFLPLATPHIRKNEDGFFYHDGRVKRFPRQFFIANSGFPGDHNFDLLKAYISGQGFVLEVYRNCGEALDLSEDNDPETNARINEFFNSVRDAGSEIVKNGRVSDTTVEKIHIKIMSDEEYMAGANEFWNEEISKNKTKGQNN